MENKIEVEEYIRTYEGIIGKILEDEDIGKNVVYIDTIFLDDYADETNFVKYEDIKKHSLNLIDLIEVGDYVNGYKILDIADSIYKNSKRILIYRNEKEKYEKWIYIQEYDGKIHTQDDIKSIVTKEQFKSIEYNI